MSTVDIGFYLVIGQYFKDSGYKDGKPSVRIAKARPKCGPHEVAVFVHTSLPESLFKRPNLQVKIEVPESKAPMIITPDIQENIARVVQEHLGITMHITAPEVSNG